MRLDEALEGRRLGLGPPPARSPGLQPLRFQEAAAGSPALARRLVQSGTLAGHAGGVSTLSWCERGRLLLSGGEDCRLRIWDAAADGALRHSLDSGHTAPILCARFLPGTGGEHVVSCSADKQVRHLNVTKGAVRPYAVHQGRVRCVLPLDPHLFFSASEDGTVREFDVRVRPPRPAPRGDAHAGDTNVLVDQRAERYGRSTRLRVGIYSLAVDEQRPWLMLTGGSDPLLRLYDRRMLPAPADGPAGRTAGGCGSARPTQWLGCYIPAHLKSALWDNARPAAMVAAAAGGAGGGGPYQLTCVAFAQGGSEVVGSYSGDFIYSFDAVQHAREVDSLLHIPESVLRGPSRPRSHGGRRSMHAWAAADAPQGTSPAAALARAATLGPTSLAGSQSVAHAVLAQAAQLQRAPLPAPGGRPIAIAASLRQLEAQRRQHSLAAPDPPARAASSRPGHWQAHPTSSTLRSPLEARGLLHPQVPQPAGSDSEEVSEGVSPEGRPQPGVRRSRRIMRRRLDAADAAAAASEEGDEVPVAGSALDEQQLAVQQHVEAGSSDGGTPQQQPAAVSGVAEAALSDSEVEVEDLVLPGRRRVRRRMAASAADENAAPRPLHHHQQAAGTALPSTAAAAPAGAGPASGGADAGHFKPPAGRLAQRPRRHAAPPAVGAAQAAARRLDSTVGLLEHQPSQLGTSEVAPGCCGGWEGGAAAAAAAAEPTVSMAVPLAADARREFSPMPIEVSSRPLPSTSRMATQQGSLALGHEASSLNSARQLELERVDSVAPLPRRDAPSVGNAPRSGMALAAAHRTRGMQHQQQHQQQQQQQQQQPEGPEASTGHMAGPGAGRNASVERHLPRHLQHHLAAAAARRGRPLVPTASTGTSRPPPPFAAAAAQRQGARPAVPAPLSSAAAGRGPGSGQLASRPPRISGSAIAEAEESAFQEQQQQGGSGLPAAQHQQQHGGSLLGAQQVTMLSGRGPSAIGDFMPDAQHASGDSEIVQAPPLAGGGTAAGQLALAGGAPPPPPPQQQQQQEQPVDSNVGAIVLGAGGEGEEVTEPTMYSRCYGGHLNMMHPSPAAGGIALAPQLGFLGAHEGLLVSPSDDGTIFLWDYSTGEIVNVLEPAGPVGAGGAAVPPLTACVACNPWQLLVASGGDSVVRLWSPEAEAACDPRRATAVVQRNAAVLAEAAAEGQPAAPLPPGFRLEDGGLQLGGRLLRGQDGRPIRCSMM